MTWTMEPTWSGMQSPILFPIYTGSKGISTGTQYPPGYRSVTETSEESSSTTDTSTSEPSDTDTDADTASTSSSSSSSSVPVGAIVGGVVGGLAAIGIFAFAVIYLIIHSRRKRATTGQNQHQGPEQPEIQKQTPPGYAGQPEIHSPSEVSGQAVALSPSQPELPYNPSPYINQGYPGTTAPPQGPWAGDGRNLEIDSRQVGELDGANYVRR